MFVKGIKFFGQSVSIACDGKCHKAWGINNRPKIQLSDDVDDYEYKSDLELGEAPLDPGTYEGGCAKPTCTSQRLNKWCARECERSSMVGQGKFVRLDNFDYRLANIRKRQEQHTTNVV